MDKVTLCLNDLVAKVMTVPVLKKKTAQYYSIDQLLDAQYALKFPAVAIVYEGMVPTDKTNKGLSNQGLFGVYVVGCAGTPKSADLETLTILKAIRDVIKDTVSPSGHHWNFFGEHIAELNLSTVTGVVYRQGWMSQIASP